MKTPEQAKAAGFTVDTTCYPWVAYKGPRFAPEVWELILTDREADLLQAVEALLADTVNYHKPLAETVKSAEEQVVEARGAVPVPKHENADPAVGQLVVWRGSNGKYYTAKVLAVVGLGAYKVKDCVDDRECEIHDERIVGKGVKAW